MNAIFTVITSFHCPCDSCCGELIRPAEVQVFGRLRDAVTEHWLCVASVIDQGEHTEVLHGEHWVTTTGESFSVNGCPSEYYDGHPGPGGAEVSLHCSGVSASSLRRIFRLMGVHNCGDFYASTSDVDGRAW